MDIQTALGVPRTYKRHPWSRILDAMVGGSVANNDLLVRDSGLWTRKAAGANGQFLKVVTGVPTWVDTIGGAGGMGLVDSATQDNDLNISNATTGTTYGDNSDLIIDLPVGTFGILFQTFVFCHQTPDLKMRLHWTGTASDVDLFITNIIEGSTNYFNGTNTAFDTDNLLTTTNSHCCTYRGTCKVTVAGTLSWQVAQNTASATAIAIQLGGSCVAYQIA